MVVIQGGSYFSLHAHFMFGNFIYIFIKNYSDIKEIEIFENCYLYTAYADETTLFLIDENSIFYLSKNFKFFLIFKD